MLNTTGQISFRTNGYAVRKLLDVYQEQVITERFGQINPLPKNMTKTIKFRRYNNFPFLVSPLAEGVPPAGQPITYQDIEAVLEQYGDSAEITDVMADTLEDPVLNWTAKRLGEQAAQIIERVRIEVLKSGTNVFYANNVASRSLVTSPLTRGDLRRIYRQFKRNQAQEITEIVKPTAMIATQPVGAAYFAMGHTDLDSDIRGITGFVPVEQYSNPTERLPTEIGKIENFRFLLTANFLPWTAAGVSGTTYLSGGAIPSSSSAADVYPLIFVARDAYGIVPLQGENAVKVAMMNPGQPTKDDQCGQKGFASWITYQTAAILNETYMARCEVAATANPT